MNRRGGSGRREARAPPTRRSRRRSSGAAEGGGGAAAAAAGTARTAASALAPRCSGRRASFLALAVAVPLAVVSVVWQHARLLDRLEGGGEYYAEVMDGERNNLEGAGWGEGVRQAVDVAKFVAYGSGLLSETDGEEDADDDGSSEGMVGIESDANLDETNMSNGLPASEQAGSIIPFDLSVNHLHLITDAPGKPPAPPLHPRASAASAPEDFLPVVRASDITFRWRHRAKAGSRHEDAERVTAYRIEARRGGGTGPPLWDSGKVEVAGELPFEVPWPGASPPSAGEVVRWRVSLWDGADVGHSSAWSKFAVGPSDEGEWAGEWIAHPDDMDTFGGGAGAKTPDACERWKMRRPLPVFRAEISSQALRSVIDDERDPLASALLVVSGLGSFRASVDGVPLSPSGPVDPPFTDYSKRVMYRAFDVTSFFAGVDGAARSHVIGVTMGSGWWDHRPLKNKIVKFVLLPRGPATLTAQLYLTTSMGNVHVLLPTEGSENNASSPWEVARGHIRESDLFTGEIVDVGVMSAMEGWDTPGARAGESALQWVTPVNYRTDVTYESRREELEIIAGAKPPTSQMRVYDNFASPIGKRVPSEIPPVLPMERIAPDEVRNLGDGRWLLDFGKALSGMLHFDEGLPTPIVPKNYPRGHGLASARGESFITVIYGDSLEMTTGDINRVLVAGMGMHDGGPRHFSKPKGAQDNAYCFPEDHDGTLSQRDVFVFPKRSVRSPESSDFISRVRQSHFTTHGFRFAEVCCSAEPPTNVHALLYRTAVPEWGTFDSSNVRINGGYELVKNSLASNMLSVQSDCPHREKLPYGGDMIANSPAAMHMYDMSAFYKKTVQDWLDAQWDNGAYTETSMYQSLNDKDGIGHGAGETAWATTPPVLTVRHMQHYGDLKLLTESIPGHIRWLEFLNQHFDAGMERFGEDLRNYRGDGSGGLGDWHSLRNRDTFLTHTAFYMAAARCVAYISKKVGFEKMATKSLAQAERVRRGLVVLYFKNGRDNFDFPLGNAFDSPGPEMGLFAKIIPGEKRCIVLKNWFRRSGEIWDGEEEKLFLSELDESYVQELVRAGELVKEGDGYMMGWSQWQGFNEGLFSMRYALKTLSDMGFHHIALQKASGFGFGTLEYCLRHNATTLWESWWRSEDLYSLNHPMLGAFAEWMSSSVAGVSLFPTTVGGRHALFWPRFPRSATVLEHASAVQGTQTGDFAIAWRFENLPEDKSQFDSALVRIRIRILVPPGGKGTLRLPNAASPRTKYSISRCRSFPDLASARSESVIRCDKRRKRRLGFPYSWEYDNKDKRWYKQLRSKSIGTPCESFLFGVMPMAAQWSGRADITDSVLEGEDKVLSAGFYDINIDDWKLEREVDGGRLGNLPEYFESSDDLGPHCKDKATFHWHYDDATHII